MTQEKRDTTRDIWTSPELLGTWLAGMDDRERKRADQFLFMAYLLPFEPSDTFTFVDLGAGTGAASRTILNVYPRAEAILVDFSSGMMDEGARAMARFEGRYRYVEADLRAHGWPAGLPTEVDAVVSSQSVHHLPDERKQSLFRDILQHLRPGGWYVNFDPLKPADAATEQAWQHVLARVEPDAPRLHQAATPAEKMRHEDHVRYMRELQPQLDLLRQAGFEAVDMYWKVLDYAIFAGRRP